MATQENSGSIFSKYKKDAEPAPRPAPGGAQKAAFNPPPPVPAGVNPPPPLPVYPPPPPLASPSEGRVAALEASVKALQAQLEILENKPAELPPPPEMGVEEPGARLVRAEAVMAELRFRIEAVEDAAAGRAAKAASKDEIKNIELRISDLAASFDGLKRTFAREGELAARLERAESSLTEFATAQQGREAQLRQNLAELAPREELDTLRVNVSASAAALDDMKKRFAQYAAEFSGVEHECRKALGEVRGYVKSAEQKPLEAKFDEYLKESVAKLSVKLAELETTMHAGMAEVAGRLTAGEILYKKVFTEAEERLRKSVEPELKSVDGQLKWLRENLIRLSDDYTVVAERKMRALEGKYSAFEAISRRMDAIDAALKKGGRIGLP